MAILTTLNFILICVMWATSYISRSSRPLRCFLALASAVVATDMAKKSKSLPLWLSEIHFRCLEMA